MTGDHRATTKSEERRGAAPASIAGVVALGALAPAAAVWSHGPDGRLGAAVLMLAALLWAVIDRSSLGVALRAATALAIVVATVAIARPLIGGVPAAVTIAATGAATLVGRSPRSHLGTTLLASAAGLWFATTMPLPTFMAIGAAALTPMLTQRMPFMAGAERNLTVQTQRQRARLAEGARGLTALARRVGIRARRLSGRLELHPDAAGATARRGAAGARLTELSARERLVIGIVLAAAVVAVASGAFAAAGDGWSPVGDDALLQVGAADVGTPSTPAVGMDTSAARYLPGFSAHHPGPLVYVWYAPFVQLWDRVGLLVGVAVLSALCLVAIAYVGVRLEGATGAVVGVGAAMATVAAVGGAAYVYHPLNAVVVLLPAFTYLVLGWALLRRRPAAVVPWVLAGSFVVQGDLQWAPLLGVPAAVLVWDRLRQVGVPGPPVPPARTLVIALCSAAGAAILGDLAGVGLVGPPTAVAVAVSTCSLLVVAWLVWWLASLVRRAAPRGRLGQRWTAAGVATLAACWALPAAEAATDNGGNLRALVHLAREADAPSIGAVESLRESAAALVFHPRTTTSAAPGSMLVLAGAATLVLAGVFVVSRWRRLGTDRRLLVVLAAGAAVGAVVGLAMFPAGEGFTSFRILPSSTAAGFLALTLVLIALDIRRVTASSAVLGAASLVVVALVAIQQPIQPQREYAEWTYRAAPQLSRQVVRAIPAGNYQVQQVGPRSFRLLRDALGRSVDRAAGTSSDVRRSPSVTDREPTEWDGQLLVVPGWVDLPEGWDVVASTGPDLDPDGSVAREAAAFLRRHGAQLTGLAAGSISRDPGLRSLFCPELAFDPDAPCPAADDALAEGGLGALPDWMQAVMLVEQFDEQQQTPLLDTPRPSDELLDRLRAAYEELPVEVYARRTR